MKNTSLVSVVIPVYNEELYISQCIESVLSQTYEYFECIIFDNCSTDKTLLLAENYERKDRRIKIYCRQKTIGMLENHNDALKAISPSSKYCKMIMGDDFLFPNCLEEMVKVAESDPAVGVVSSYRLIESVVGNVGLPFGKNVYSGKDVCRLQLLDENIYLFGSQSSVLYRSDIVRERGDFFYKSSIFFDAEVCYQMLKDNKFGFIHQILTFTRRNNESFTSNINRFRPSLLARYICFKKYGRIYLSDIEYLKKEKDIEHKYYSYLGKKIFTNKDKEFWKFHLSELEKVGIFIDKPKLIISALMYLLDMGLNPKKTIEYMLRKKDENGGSIAY